MARKRAIYNSVSSRRALEGARTAQRKHPVLQHPETTGTLTPSTRPDLPHTNGIINLYMSALFQDYTYHYLQNSLKIIYSRRRIATSKLLRPHADQIRQSRCPELLHLVCRDPGGVQGQRAQVLQVLQVFETGVGHPGV